MSRGISKGSALIWLACVWGAASLCGPASRAHGFDVLVYDVNSVEHVAETAALQGGFDVTVAVSPIGFVSELDSGDWDLVAVDLPSNGMTPLVEAALEEYVADEGRVVFSFWNLDEFVGLQALFDVAVATDYTTPLDIHMWIPTHPIFNRPNSVPTTVPSFGDPWGDDGDRLVVGSGGVALAGFAGTAVVTEVAVVLGNDGHTIVNGFVYDSYEAPVITALVENQMHYLLSGASIPPFVRGDANDDGSFDVSDAVYQLAALFVPGAPVPTCRDAADTNDDGAVDISDPVEALTSLFVAGASVPPPPSSSCGFDPTADSLDCVAFGQCP